MARSLKQITESKINHLLSVNIHFAWLIFDEIEIRNNVLVDLKKVKNTSQMKQLSSVQDSMFAPLLINRIFGNHRIT